MEKLTEIYLTLRKFKKGWNLC